MAGKNIVQSISLEGGEAIKKQFQDIGKAGAEAFKQLSDAQGLQSELNVFFFRRAPWFSCGQYTSSMLWKIDNPQDLLR